MVSFNSNDCITQFYNNNNNISKIMETIKCNCHNMNWLPLPFIHTKNINSDKTKTSKERNEYKSECCSKSSFKRFWMGMNKISQNWKEWYDALDAWCWWWWKGVKIKFIIWLCVWDFYLLVVFISFSFK